MDGNADGQIERQKAVEDAVPDVGMHHAAPGEPARDASAGDRYGQQHIKRWCHQVFEHQLVPEEQAAEMDIHAG
jgi:hypothetical protein